MVGMEKCLHTNTHRLSGRSDIHRCRDHVVGVVGNAVVGLRHEMRPIDLQQRPENIAAVPLVRDGVVGEHLEGNIARAIARQPNRLVVEFQLDVGLAAEQNVWPIVWRLTIFQLQ